MKLKSNSFFPLFIFFSLICFFFFAKIGLAEAPLFKKLQEKDVKKSQDSGSPLSEAISRPRRLRPEGLSSIKASRDLDKNKIEDCLDELIKQTTEPEKEERVLVLLNVPFNESHLDEFRFLRGRVKHTYRYATQGFSGTIPVGRLKALANRLGPHLKIVKKAKPILMHLDKSVRIIRARDAAWTYGYAGDPDNPVAILDTGIDNSHPDLSGKIDAWYDTTDDNSPSAEDYQSHGTHVASTAAGTGAALGSGLIPQLTATYTGLLPDSIGSGWVDMFEIPPQATLGDITLEMHTDQPGETSWLSLRYPTINDILNPKSGNESSTDDPHIVIYDAPGTGTYFAVSGQNDPQLTGDPYSTLETFPYQEVGDGYNLFTGVAPGADLVGVKIFDNTGTGWNYDMVEAFDWIIYNKETHHIKVASMSAGLSVVDTDLRAAANTVVENGIVFTISAGNDYPGTIKDPALASKIICVGATNDNDQITDYSSNGPGGSSKPDVVAPGGSFQIGSKITAVDTNDCDGDTVGFADRQANDYTNMGGTSMSCPHVAGLAALIIQALEDDGYTWSYVEADALKVKMLILMTANETNQSGEDPDGAGGTPSNTPPLNRGGKDLVEGYGRINADAAIEAVTMQHTGSTEYDTLGSTSLDKKVWARKVDMPAGEEITFSLDVPSGADYDLYLYEGTPDTNGDPVILASSTSSATGGNIETIAYTATGPETDYIVAKWVSGDGEFILSSDLVPTPMIDVDIYEDSSYSQEDKFFDNGDTIYIRADVTLRGSPLTEATVTATLVNGGTSIPLVLDEVGGGIYRKAWDSTTHPNGVYLVEVTTDYSPSGSGQAYFHLYPGSGVSAYSLDYDEDGNVDYVLENKHLIAVYDGRENTDKSLLYLYQKDTDVKYNFADISDPDSIGRGEITTTDMEDIKFHTFSLSPEGENLTSAALGISADVTGITSGGQSCMLDDDATGTRPNAIGCGIRADFTAAASGTLEFWARCRVQAVGDSFDIMLEDGSGTIGPDIYFLSGNIGYYDGSQQTIMSYTPDQWYRFKIVFDCGADTMDIYIDDMENPVASGAGFWSSLTNISRIEFDTGQWVSGSAQKDYFDPLCYVDDIDIYSGETHLLTDDFEAHTAGLDPGSPWTPIEDSASTNVEISDTVYHEGGATTTLDLSIRMKAEEDDYLVYNLSGFDENINDILDIFSPISGSFGSSGEDDRYYIGNGTDDWITNLSSGTWINFSSLTGQQKYVAIYDDSLISDDVDDNVISWIYFPAADSVAFQDVGAWYETGAGALRIRYDTTSASTSDQAEYLLVFTQGDYNVIDQWMPAIAGGGYPDINFMSSHDVAVTGISAPGSVAQGDTATIDVYVANEGTFTETFDVVLEDTTYTEVIGTETVTSLAPSGTTMVTFNWTTDGLTELGDHTLEATAGPVADEVDTDDNSMSAVVGVTPPPQTVISDYASGTPTVPPDSVNRGSSDNCLGTFLFDGEGTVSSITITEYGTCDADADLENVRLFQDDSDGNWEPSQDTIPLGATTTFDVTDKAAFSGFNLSAGANTYVHVVLDVKSSAADGATIGIEIHEITDIISTTEVTALGWPVQLGTATVTTAPAWTAYNDCGDDQNSSYGSTGNVTNFGAEDAPGELIKYSDGTTTGVTITYSGTSYTEGTGCDGEHGNPSYPPSGDAAAEFGEIINMGKLSYAATGSANYMTVTLSGVSSSGTYTLVVLGMRGVSSYVRDSKYVISGVDSFTNASSGGATISTTTMTDDTTTCATGDNWTTGYVAKWTDIVPTGDNIVITVYAVDTVDDKGYLSAIKLTEEVPTIPAITVASSVPQPPHVTVSSAGNVMGIASIARNTGTGQVTAVTLKENGGTIDAATELEDIELWLSSDKLWDPGDTQLDTAKSFNGADGECTFTQTFDVTAAPRYLIVRADVAAGATVGDTIEIQVKGITTADIVNGVPCDISGTTSVSVDWWNASWLYKKRLTFDNSGQAEDLTNFPVLAKLTPSNFNFSLARDNGEDIRFVDSDNAAQLNYEIERWDSTAQEAVIWVKVPQIDGSSSADFIYMYYGNISAVDNQDAAGVWSNGYAAVYHFAEQSGFYQDSTGTNHANTQQVRSRNNTDVNGLGYYPEFGGYTFADYVGVPDNDSLDFGAGDFTVLVRAKTTSTLFDTDLIRKGSTGVTENSWWKLEWGEGSTNNRAHWLIRVNGVDKQINYDTLSPDGNWHDMWGARDTANTLIKLFIDGSSISSTAGDNGSVSNSANMGIGSKDTYNDDHFEGNLDEVRLSNVLRSADWIAAQHKSITDTFIIFANPYAELAGPASVTAGEVSGAFTLTGLDEYGEPANVTEDTAFTLSSDSTGAYTFYSDPGGTAVITSVTISAGTSSAAFYYKDTGAGQPTVTAAWFSGGESLGSATHQLTVNPTVENKLAFGQQPSDTVVDGIMSAITVRILDVYDNLVTTATDPVTIAIDTNPVSGTLSGTTTKNAVNGIATFNDLSIDTIGIGYTLEATSGILAGAISDSFDIVEELPQATVGFVCDARPQLFVDGETLLTVDLNQLDDQMDTGWLLDAVTTAGDMDYISEAGQQTCDNAHAASDISAVPFIYCVGNHETDNPYDMPVLRSRYSSYPDWNKQPGPANCTTTTFSFDVGNIHVVMLNEYFNGTSDTGTDGDIVDELFDWLKSDLRNSTKPYKVVVGHEPAYPVIRHVGDSLDKYPSHRNRFWNLLKTEGVIAYFTGHDHIYHFTEHDGVYEVDAGVTGGMLGGGNDEFATLLYAHYDNDGFVIRAVNEGGPDWSGTPVVTTKTRSDLETQVLVNTAERAGTVCRYFIDYTSTVESNPNWSANNSGVWWEDAFDDNAAGWSDGELTVGYDSTNPSAWGWLNQQINPDPTTSGDEQVHAVFTRIPFTAYDKNLYTSMKLGIDYDDAVTVWLNGVKIYESPTSPTISSTDYWNKAATADHPAGGDEALNPVFQTIDVSAYMNSLNEGNNLLVIGNWNYTPGSDDLIAGIKLYLTKTTSFQDGVYPDSGYAGTRDTYISENNPFANYGDSTILMVDGDDPSGSYYDKSALLKWDISSVPSGGTVTSATITINVTNGTANTYQLYEMKQDWLEGDGTPVSGADWYTYDGIDFWQSYGAKGANDRGSLVLGTVTGSAGLREIPLNADGIALVQSWADSPAGNYGVIIANESNTDGLDFDSREATIATNRPKLTIAYTIGEDTTPPAVITDLYAFTGTYPGEIDLTWTAPGDDENTGIATSYVVKYSPFAITDQTDFDNAATYAQSWSPLPAGSTENKTLTGLTEGTTFYIAIEAKDEVPNQAGLSNTDTNDAMAQVVVLSVSVDPDNWPIGNLDGGNTASTFVSGIQGRFIAINDGNAAEDLSIKVAASTPSGWTPSDTQGPDIFVMGHGQASGGSYEIEGSYTSIDTTGVLLASDLAVLDFYRFNLQFKSPSSTGDTVGQTIVVTIEAQLP